jgi:hypothetical protein
MALSIAKMMRRSEKKKKPTHTHTHTTNTFNFGAMVGFSQFLFGFHISSPDERRVSVVFDESLSLSLSHLSDNRKGKRISQLETKQNKTKQIK